VLLLVASGLVLWVAPNRFKPGLEVSASDALGMAVHVGSRLRMGFFPGFHITADDGSILSEQGVSVASAKQVTFWIELLPLLRREVRLRRIDVSQPRLLIERDREGRLNVERLKKAIPLLAALDGASLSLTDGTLLYADQRSGQAFEATDFDVVVRRLRLARGRSAPFLKGVDLEAQISCEEIRTKNLSVSSVKISVDGKAGVFEFEPITLRLFGGQMSGDIHADLAGPVPRCLIHCALPRFRIEEFLATLSPRKAAEGPMDFSASLSMQGTTWRQMVQNAAGEVSLRGDNLILEGQDLDGNLSRFESSQNFSLVDMGAVFFAGPLGLAVTKGYNFAGLFQGPGGTTKIRTLVSKWRVERGVAQAKDVAMATSQNRLALRGGLDFVNGQFADVTVAVIDAKGCAGVRQSIRGSFEKPVVEKPRALTSLSGPLTRLYKHARGLFPAGPCEPFYSGSVAAPR
jgi:uncharacterized protein involved in outer membrane biogenesis